MLALIFTLAAMNGYPDVTGYARDQVRVYEKQDGKEVYVGALDRKTLPPHAHVVDVDAIGRPGIMVGTRTVYLKNSDVYWEGVSPCQDTAMAQRPSNEKLAATPGVASGLSNGSQRCVK